MESLLSGWKRGWGCYLGLRILGLDYNRTFPEDYFRSDHWRGSRGITSHRFTWLESKEATLLGKVSLERHLNGRWPRCKMHQDHFGVLLPPSWWPQVRAHYWHKYWGQFNRYNPSMQVIGVNIEPFTLKKQHNLTNPRPQTRCGYGGVPDTAPCFPASHFMCCRALFIIPFSSPLSHILGPWLWRRTKISLWVMVPEQIGADCIICPMLSWASIATLC